MDMGVADMHQGEEWGSMFQQEQEPWGPDQDFASSSQDHRGWDTEMELMEMFTVARHSSNSNICR